MVRKFVAATVSAALCMGSVTPALAQNYTQSVVQAPLGATATVNFRMPLGAGPTLKEPTYGLTLGYGQLVGAGQDGQALTREVKIADLRFGTDGYIRQANVASFDLANMDEDRRFDNLTGEGNTLWIVVGLVAAGVAICLLADCFEGDDEEDSSHSSD
jgi:hypothetical protein